MFFLCCTIFFWPEKKNIFVYEMNGSELNRMNQANTCSGLNVLRARACVCVDREQHFKFKKNPTRI